MLAKLLQSCLTLCNPVGFSSPGSSVHGILQARILEWVAVPSSRVSSRLRDGTPSLMSPALADGFFTTSATWGAPPVIGRHQMMWGLLSFGDLSCQSLWILQLLLLSFCSGLGGAAENLRAVRVQTSLNFLFCFRSPPS